jgi:AhpD family alkylhydroperoxidase
MMNRQDVKREAQQMIGVVPGFFDTMPEPHVGPMWEHFRDVQLRPGQIPAKYQQLIMLAVSAYAKCKYCTDFHTEVAKALGATKEEIAEVALLTGLTADFSNYLGGTQYDFEQFKREVRTACQFMSSNGGSRGTSASKPGAPEQRR